LVNRGHLSRQRGRPARRPEGRGHARISGHTSRDSPHPSVLPADPNGTGRGLRPRPRWRETG
jgi:cytochrome oxidase assembly protein ShyY1